MSVDKFGRHEGILPQRKVRGPPGEGFKLTPKGHYDMSNKVVRNMGEPKAGKDAVTLHYLQKHCLIKDESKSIECGNVILRNIGEPELQNDAVSLQYMRNESLRRTPEGDYDVQNKLIKNVGLPTEDSDVVTRGYVNGAMRMFRKEFDDKFVRLESIIFKHVHKHHEVVQGIRENI